MSDHEEKADQAEHEADQLEDESGRIEQQVEDAKGKVKQMYDDPVIAEPLEQDAEDAPETDYPSKG